MKRTFGFWIGSAVIALGGTTIGNAAHARVYPGSSGRAYNPNGQACVSYERIGFEAGQGIAVAPQCQSVEVEVPVLLPYGIFTLIGTTFSAFGNSTGDVSCNLVVIDGVTGQFVSQSGYRSNSAPGFQTVTLDNTTTSANSVGYVDCILRNGAILEIVSVNEVGGEPLKTWPGSSGHAVSGNSEQSCLTYTGTMITNSKCIQAQVVIPVPAPDDALFSSTGRITVFSSQPQSVTCRFVSFDPTGAIAGAPPSFTISFQTNAFDDLDLGSVFADGGALAYDCLLNQGAGVLATYTSP